MMTSRFLALIAVLVPSLVSAQSIISELDEETTYSATLEVAVWDPSETNPFSATKRMALSLLPAGGGGGGATTFVDLTDTPAAIAAGQCVQGNNAGTVLVFGSCGTGGGGGSTTFVGLTDVPSAFVNTNFLRSTASALEFRTPAQVRADIGANNASNLSSGTVANARIPAAIARDTELPSANALVPTTGTTGFVLTKTATGRDWAAGAGGGAFSRTELGTLTTSTTSGDIAPITLSEAITSGNVIEIIIDPTSANDGAMEYVSFVADAWLALTAQATEPAVGDTQVAHRVQGHAGKRRPEYRLWLGKHLRMAWLDRLATLFCDRATARPRRGGDRLPDEPRRPGGSDWCHGRGRCGRH